MKHERDLGGDQTFVPGMNRKGLYKLFAEMGFKTGAEIGVYMGENAKDMFNIIPGLKLYLVDPYLGHSNLGYHKLSKNIYIPHKRKNKLAEAQKHAHEILDGRNVEWLETYSEDAQKLVPNFSLDFVYIDGDHAYDFVMMDIIFWNRKVRKGGIVSGHDFFRSHMVYCAVSLAVMHYTRQHDIKYFITDRLAEPHLPTAFPSWYWIKDRDTYIW